MGHLLGKEIEKEIKQTISISQKLGSDFIGFGEIARGNVSSKQWNKINWRQQFPQVPIKVKVSANISRSGVALGQIMA